MSATTLSDQENWVRSDNYHNSFLLKPDDALAHALKSSDENGLPHIAVSAAQGKYLNLVAKTIKAKRVLEVAKANFEYAGVASKIEIIVGSATETLPKLQTEPFDLVFIDADKESNALYYKEARRLSKSGTVIIVDNVVRNGRTADPEINTPDVIGVRQLLQAIKEDEGVEATTIATVGEKHYDGFTYILVL